MKNRSRGARPAFSLVELLVVIGIIVVLMALLVPTINRVRIQAQASDTQAQINNLSALIQAYYSDFKAYPGPIPNTQLRSAASNVTQPAGIATNITMAENLYLGLMGGLRPGTPAGTFAYDAAIAGQGPRWLGITPKKLPPYGDNVNISAGDFVDDSGTNCLDSAIPEYVDRFGEQLPILYLRARPGIVTPTGQPIVSATPSATAQYDLTQVSTYTSPVAVGGKSIGVTKDNDGIPRKSLSGPAKKFDEHGFTSAAGDAPNANAVTDPNATSPQVYSYPYNIVAALRHPTLANTPKQQDGFILISAGTDRVYGTKDDITNFGQY